jgi:hypothetical protein
VSEQFKFERFDVDGSGHWETSDGDWIRAQDALDREAVLLAKISTLEAQWNEAEKRARLNHKKWAALDTDSMNVIAQLRRTIASGDVEIMRLRTLVAETRDNALDEAATVVAQHDREGRGWIPGSLWDTLANEAAARVRALKQGS